MVIRKRNVIQLLILFFVLFGCSTSVTNSINYSEEATSNRENSISPSSHLGFESQTSNDSDNSHVAMQPSFSEDTPISIRGVSFFYEYQKHSSITVAIDYVMRSPGTYHVLCFFDDTANGNYIADTVFSEDDYNNAFDRKGRPVNYKRVSFVFDLSKIPLNTKNVYFAVVSYDNATGSSLADYQIKEVIKISIWYIDDQYIWFERWVALCD